MGAGLSDFMINGYLDFHNITPFVPYLTAGIGIGLPLRVVDYLTGDEYYHEIESIPASFV